MSGILPRGGILLARATRQKSQAITRAQSNVVQPPYRELSAAALISCWKISGKALESRMMPDARSVIVYSRKGCHLCELVKESLTKLSRRGGFTWQEVDVDADTELRRQYNDEVPVVFIDGHKAFKYHMNEQEFLRKLAS
jgi:glutaredoxin